jgi:hypothetical protein
MVDVLFALSCVHRCCIDYLSVPCNEAVYRYSFSRSWSGGQVLLSLLAVRFREFLQNIQERMNALS